MITIAIPFFNAEKYLAEAIHSVISQTYTEWKLLLVDDGSTDKSLAIAKSFQEKDDRISIYSDGLNKNLGFRLNQIPTLVNTVYLARMDADDIMHPERIEKQLNVLLKHQDIDVLGTNAYTIDENSEVFGIRKKIDDINSVLNVNSFIHPSIIAKTEWFKNNPYDVKAVRIEDAELWFRTKNTSNFKMLIEPLLFYREFGGDYYKKYKKVIPSIYYLKKKYPKSKQWTQTLIKFNLNTIVYYIFEKILKSEYLFLRRNQEIFNKREHYKKFI